ncbi:MAG: hypothetical protein JSW36_07715 [Burkholderiales bacterium]|nr:MAG: hypothetical protein JSW36_07715 [Burkholderiales bacterium]
MITIKPGARRDARPPPMARRAIGTSAATPLSIVIIGRSPWTALAFASSSLFDLAREAGDPAQPTAGRRTGHSLTRAALGR